MDHEAVSDAIREVAQATIRPRFRALGADDIETKSDGEPVTVADRDCEAALRVRLQQIHGVPVLGEEATSESSAELDLLHTSEQLWVVDPLDGTANFARGSVDYAVMVAFVEQGVTTAGWIWAPEHNLLAVAARGHGATLNGELVRASAPPAPTQELSGIVKGRGAPAAVVDTVLRNLSRLGKPRQGWSCAGIEYPKIIAGAADFITYWRTLPWDHAAGVLIAEEAGLCAVRPDGTPYRVDDGADGLIVGHPRRVDEIRTVLFGE
ncbi:MAG: inositol monophosphatase [Actinomycetota bacterium]